MTGYLRGKLDPSKNLAIFAHSDSTPQIDTELRAVSGQMSLDNAVYVANHVQT
jgi:hypothetical protein